MPEDMPSERRAEKRDMTEDREWHLDKKVPVAIILALLVQTAGIAWWGATTEARIASLEQVKQIHDRQIDGITAKFEKSDTSQADINVRLVRVEERTQAVLDTANKIDGKLDKLAAAVGNPAKLAP